MRKNIYIIMQAAMLSFALCGCASLQNRAGGIADDRGIPVSDMERAYKDDSPDPVFDGGSSTFYGSAENDAARTRTYKPDEYVAARVIGEEREAAIKAGVLDVSGVEKAAVIINDNAAIIGVTLTGNPNSREQISIKREIEKAALYADPSLSRVAVTATPELYQQMNRKLFPMSISY